MDNNGFILDIIAALNKQLSKAQLKNDLKGIDNTLYVKVIAKLATSLSKKQLANSLKQLNNLYVQVGTKFKTDKNEKNKLLNEIKQLQENLTELQLKIGVEKSAPANLVKSVISTAKTAQRYADKTSITLDIDVRKEKVINDILYIGKKYSKLFSNVAASQKYENLLSSAYFISDKSQLQDVKTQIAAFNSELRASGLAAESTGNKWKRLTERARDLFSAASIIRIAFTQVRQAVSTTINLDKVYTDLVKVNDELNRNDYADYLERCNKKAQELATMQKALIEGATEFSKSGYDLSTSDKLTEKSTILSNVGDMSASDSAKAIISGVQAYDVVDGYTDVVDKAQALIDKYNEIGNTASITTSEIAQGVQTVGSVFKDANTSVDELIAMASAGNRQYQDADSLFLGLRTAALRIRGCTAELEAMGEETDTVITSTAKLEEKIKGLTNINGSGGVEILEADGKTFRSIYDIFLDISKVYKDMNDTDASALLELIAGKHRASAISATLNNMTEAEKILQNSLNATGSAQKEYDKYLESTEAHIAQFQSKLVETYSTFLDGNMISHAADLGTAMLDLVNKTDLLKHGLVAIATLKIGQGISAIGGVIANTSKQMNILSDAIQQVKNLPLDDVLKTKPLIEIGEATKSLTEKNLKLLLSQNNLKEQDKILILQQHNLTEEEALAKLEKMGLTEVTNANTAANTANAGSVTTLKGAFTGLTTSIKATWTAMSTLQKASIIFAAISTAWSIGSSIVNNIKQSNEELRQATEEAADAYKETTSSIDDYVSKYQELREALIKAKGDEEATYDVKSQLLDLQKNLNDAYGNEYGRVNLVTEAYKNQTQTIKELNKEAAQTFLNENREGIEDAEKSMAKERHYNLSYTGMIANSDEGAALKEIAEKYRDQGVTLLDELGDGSYAQFSIHLNADAQSAYQTINDFENDLRNKAKELGDEHLFDDVLNISSDSLNKAQDVIDKYGEIFNQALTAEIAADNDKAKTYSEALKAVESYNEAVLNSENPYEDEKVAEAKNNLDAIRNSIQENEAEWGRYSVLMDNVFDQADTRLYDFNESFKSDSGMKKLADDLKGFTDLDLQAFDDIAGENESFDKLKKSAQDYGISVEELINTLVRLGYVQGEIQDSEIEVNTTVSFSDAWTSITDNSDLKSFKDSVTELADAGRLTAEKFSQIDGSDTFLKQIGISAEEAIKKINRLSDESTQLSSMSSQISDISNALGTKLSDGFVNADTLSGFDVELRGLESWDRFQSVLGSTTSSYKECQEAANALATEWVNSSDFLAQLTEENKEYYETQLESMGIENYEEIISCAQALNEAKEALSEASIDLGTATSDEIQAFIDESAYSELAQQQIWALYYAKLAESETFLDSTEDCQHLQALADHSMLTANAVQLLTRLIQIYNGMESGVYGHNTEVYQNAVREANEIKAQIEALANGEGEGLIKNQNLTPKLNPVGSKASGSGSSSKKAEDTLNGILEYYQTCLDNGYISLGDWLGKSKDAIDGYYAQGKIDADDYFNHLKDLAEHLKDVYDGVADTVSGVLDNAIDGLKDQMDALDDSKDSVESKYETEITYWKKQKENLQDEIDLIEKANEKRQNAIDLQKAKWEQERAENQRTRLTYVEGHDGVEGQMVYLNDPKSVREKQEAVADAEYKIQLQKLNDTLDEYTKKIEIIEKQRDNEIDGIERQREALQKQINEYEKYKQKWADVTTALEDEYEKQYAAAVLGADWEAQVLAGRTDVLNKFATDYAAIQDNIRYYTAKGAETENVIPLGLQNLPTDLSLISAGISTPVNEILNGMDGVTNAANSIDTSNVAMQASNISTGLQPACQSISDTTQKFQELSDKISNYSIPEIDSSNLVTSFETVRTQLSEFADEFQSLCGQLTNSWSAFIGAMNSGASGGGNGDPLAGGLDNDISSYASLFNPLFDSMDAAESTFTQKLIEWTETWSTAKNDISSIIGVGGGASSSGTSGSESKGKSDKKSGEKSDGKSSGSEADSLVGAVEAGGQSIATSFEETWTPALVDMGNYINEWCQKVIDMFNEMADKAIRDAAAAIDAAKEAAKGSDGDVSGLSSAGAYTGHAFATGTKGLSEKENNALLSEYNQPEMAVFPDGHHELYTEPTLTELPKGTVIYNEKQTKELLKNKEKTAEHGKAYAKGTELVPFKPDDTMMFAGKMMTYAEVEDLGRRFAETLKGTDFVPNSYYRGMEEMSRMVTNIQNNIVKNITNNQPSFTIGEIHVHDVQNVDAFANAIKNRLPSKMLQELYRR